MTKVTNLSVGLCLLLAGAPATLAQETPEDAAATQAVYREANRIALRQKLAEAASEQARHETTAAAKLYDAAWDLVQKIGPNNVQPEAAQTRTGLVSVRLELARAAQRGGNLLEADTQIKDALRVDPKNPAALDFKRGNDALLAETAGKRPSPEVEAVKKDVAAEQVQVGTLVQDGKLLYEMGKMEQAEVKLRQALRQDPANQAAWYYVSLIQEARFAQAQNLRETANRQQLADVEQAWATPIKRELLPIPNPYARTNLVHTGSGREVIYRKLDRIVLHKLKYDNLDLLHVLIELNNVAINSDPEKRGINFIVSMNADSGAAAPTAPGAIDAATGLPMPQAAAAEQVDPNTALIKIDPELTDVRLADALDIITKVADKPIKYSIEDYGVVFSSRGAREAQPLYTRTFKVDPNTFYQGLESVSGLIFGEVATGTTGGMGGGGGGGGQSQQGQGTVGAIVARVVTAAGQVSGGMQGGGGGQIGGGAGGGGGGLRFITRTNSMADVQLAARSFFETVGVDLAPPKTLFFNDRLGQLIVRATLADLDLIDAAIQVLNSVPPQVNIKARFIEVAQTDNKGLGFDWYLGNFLMNNNSIGAQGGTAPSYNGAPTTANPLGFFPNPVQNISPSDQLITGGLRNPQNTLFTLTGILTDPQFRVVLKAIEQRSGFDELSSPEVTIISGRQAQMKATDVQTIIVNYDFSQVVGNFGGGAGGGVPSDRNIKQNFQTVDPQQVLAKVAALPITEWSYKADATTRHIGPMAQDFHAAFNVGSSDKQIAIVDASGVALAAIKGLDEKNARLEAEVKQATAQLEAKDAEIKALRQRLDKLEQMLSRLDK